MLNMIEYVAAQLGGRMTAVVQVNRVIDGGMTAVVTCVQVIGAE
jgi:hypothetical protein